MARSTSTEQGCSLANGLGDLLAHVPRESWEIQQGLIAEMTRHDEQVSSGPPPPPPGPPPFRAAPPPPGPLPFCAGAAPPAPGPPPFRAEASEDGDGGPYGWRWRGAETDHGLSYAVSATGHTALLDFNAAFNRHDLRGTGSIDIEDVRELMRDLGIEPGAGPWLLD